MPSTLTLIVAALSFVVTFSVARLLAKWWRKRNGRGIEAREAAQANAGSRQVRRAKARRNARR
jgi:hypothetical protein